MTRSKKKIIKIQPKDYEKIISIQEKIIKIQEEESDIAYRTWCNEVDRSSIYYQAYTRYKYIAEELQRQLEHRISEYNDIVRSYNALAQMGKFAEELGIDIKKHTKSLPENSKYTDFKITNKLLESGKVSTVFSMKKKPTKKRKSRKVKND
jgi:hypothetical protein